MVVQRSLRNGRCGCDLIHAYARIALLAKELIGRIEDALSGALSGGWHQSVPFLECILPSEFTMVAVKPEMRFSSMLALRSRILARRRGSHERAIDSYPLWPSTNFGLPASYDHPRVEFLPPTEIVALRYGSF